MNRKTYFYKNTFKLESGNSLPQLEIAYHTYGKLNPAKDNVVWICHALTANSDVADWWSGLVGKEKLFDPNDYFIVCANILGSCYGTTGPLSKNPLTDEPYYNSFPAVTVRDIVNAHILLKAYLGIEKIHTAIGGSLGGSQVLEWAVMEPKTIENCVFIAANVKETPWAIAFHTAQRMAIENDVSWGEKNAKAGLRGLKVARAVGMLSYRNYQAFCNTQSDEDDDKVDHFKVSSYLDYQGEKLLKRFNAYSYWVLTKTMDSHNIARKRKKTEEVLNSIISRSLVIGISSDFLCPVNEIEILVTHIPDSIYKEIDSPYGHDGFLIEYAQLTNIIKDFLITEKSIT